MALGLHVRLRVSGESVSVSVALGLHVRVGVSAMGAACETGGFGIVANGCGRRCLVQPSLQSGHLSHADTTVTTRQVSGGSDHTSSEWRE